MSTSKSQLLNNHWSYIYTNTHTHTYRHLAKKCVCKNTNHNKTVGETHLYNKFPYQIVGWPTNWRTTILQKFWFPHQAPQPRGLASGESPRIFGFEDQQGLTAGSPQDGAIRDSTLGGHTHDLTNTSTQGQSNDSIGAWTRLTRQSQHCWSHPPQKLWWTPQQNFTQPALFSTPSS